MKPWILIAAFASIVSPTFTRSAVGQSADSASSTLVSILRQTESLNRVVRIQTSATTVTGRVRVLSNNSFRLNGRTYTAGDVERLEVRIPNSDPLWNGALIGSVLSATLLGTALTQFAIDMSESQISGRERFSYYLGSALFGILVGGAIDAAREAPLTWHSAFSR